MSTAGGAAPVNIAVAWLKAVDARDATALIALSAPTIEVAGPRGVNGGRGALVAWFSRVAMGVRLQRAYVRGNLVLVEHEAVWRDPETRALQAEADIAGVFTVVDGLVARYERIDDPVLGLKTNGFIAADEVPLPA